VFSGGWVRKGAWATHHSFYVSEICNSTIGSPIGYLGVGGTPPNPDFVLDVWFLLIRLLTVLFDLVCGGHVLRFLPFGYEIVAGYLVGHGVVNPKPPGGKDNNHTLQTGFQQGVDLNTVFFFFVGGIGVRFPPSPQKLCAPNGESFGGGRLVTGQLLGSLSPPITFGQLTGGGGGAPVQTNAQFLSFHHPHQTRIGSPPFSGFLVGSLIQLAHTNQFFLTGGFFPLVSIPGQILFFLP